jgi:hypothetical protein
LKDLDHWIQEGHVAEISVLWEKGILKERESSEPESPEGWSQHESLVNEGTCGEWKLAPKKINFKGIRV